MAGFNPYVAGPPLTGDEGFYGREDIFRFVRDTLALPYQNAIVLFGQRRIGKTSLLYQLQKPHRSPPGFHPVYFDLQGRAQQRLDEVLFGLAKNIAKSLALPAPQQVDFRGDGDHFRQRFLPRVYEVLGDRRLLLLFDEFEVLGERPLGEDAAIETLFPYLQELIAEEDRLAFIFVVGRRIDELPSRFKSTFKTAQFKRISVLSREDAVRLITDPAKDVLRYDAAALDRILFLTARHPYFTQLICYVLFDRLRQRGQRRVTAADVDAVIEDAMEMGAAGLTWFWDAFPPAERFILSAIAHVTGEGGVATEEEIREALQRYGVQLLGMELTNAPDVLVEWEMLAREGRDSYRFVVEFLRRWIVAKHSIEETRRELMLASPRAISLYEAARSAHSEGDLDTAIEDYRRALAANPNHARAQLGLAQALYEQGRLAEAIPEFERACKLDGAGAREGLIAARLALGKALEAEGKADEAIAEYESVLKLAPDHEEARSRLISVWTGLGEAYLAADRLDRALEAFRRALELKPLDEELRERIAAVNLRRRELMEIEWKRGAVKLGLREDQLREEKRLRELAEAKARRTARYIELIALFALVGLALSAAGSALIYVRLAALACLFAVLYLAYEWRFGRPSVPTDLARRLSNLPRRVTDWLSRRRAFLARVVGRLEIIDPDGERSVVNLTTMGQRVVTLGRAGDVVLDKDPSLGDVEAEIRARIEEGKVTWWLWRADEGETPLYDNASFALGSYHVRYLNPEAQPASDQ